jgi:hypothetical protein
MRNKLNYVLTVAAVVARNADKVASVLGLALSAFGRSLESGVQVCTGALGRTPALVAVKMFSH